ncbi:MAG: hypothetical protein ACKO7B_19390, partial [Flavobacteriales bacterium]
PNNPANVNYSWVIGNGAPFSTDANPTVSPTSTTTYTVNLSGSGCGGETDNITVTVIPAAFSVTASANSSSNTITICAGSSLDLSSSVAGVPAGQNVTYDWDGPNSYNNSNANPAAFTAGANAGGTYTVTASIGDCEVTDNIAVNVISASINNTLNGQNILVYCLQQNETSGQVGFNINLPSNLGPISFYQVNWDDGSPIQQVSGTTSPS